MPALAQVWPWFVCVSFAVFFLTGGVSVPSGELLLAHTILALALLGCAVYRLRDGLPSRRSFYALIIAGTGLALVLLQILPLPPFIWQALPGRDYVVPVFDAAGLAGTWQPVSLTPDQTLRSGLMALPALSLFLATLSFGEGDGERLAATVVVLALIGVAIALVQFAQGKDSLLDFNDTVAEGTAASTFGNRSLFATQLFASLPVLAAFVLNRSERRRWRGWPAAGLGAAVAGVLLTGVALTGSRAGVVLSMLAIALSILMLAMVRRKNGGGGFKASGLAFLGALAALMVIGQASMAGLLRLAARDPLEDFRSVMNAVSLDAAWMFFPAGSGIGTFVPVYQLAETPARMTDNYVNQAHNDPLQFLVEGGLPALIIMALLAVWLAAAAGIVWRSAIVRGNGLYGRAFSLSLLLVLAHSLADFPLRTVALLSLFGVAAAVLCLPLRAPRPGRLPLGTQALETEAPAVAAGQTAALQTQKPLWHRRPARAGQRANDSGGGLAQ